MNLKNILIAFSVMLLVACTPEGGAPDTAQDATAKADTSSAAAAAQAAAIAGSANTVDVEVLVAAADPELGKRQFIYCQACHSLNEGGPNKIGPNLYGVFGRAAAGADGFMYSAPLNESGLVWDAGTLDSWIESPGALVPGTTMVFAGIRDAEARANLIAYMQQETTQ